MNTKHEYLVKARINLITSRQGERKKKRNVFAYKSRISRRYFNRPCVHVVLYYCNKNHKQKSIYLYLISVIFFFFYTHPPISFCPYDNLWFSRKQTEWHLYHSFRLYNCNDTCRRTVIILKRHICVNILWFFFFYGETKKVHTF